MRPTQYFMILAVFATGIHATHSAFLSPAFDFKDAQDEFVKDGEGIQPWGLSERPKCINGQIRSVDIIYAQIHNPKYCMKSFKGEDCGEDDLSSATTWHGEIKFGHQEFDSSTLSAMVENGECREEIKVEED